MQSAHYFSHEAASCRRSAADLPAGRQRSGLLVLARHYDREARRAGDDGPNIRLI